MNKIYKVVWSKVKHQYVVVSELAHSCTKHTGRTVGKSTAAVMAALALSIGVGVMPALAINNSSATTEIITGKTSNNYSAYLDEENTITSSNGSYVIGDGNAIKNFDDTFVLGNGNTLYTSSSGGSISSENTIVIGNGNSTTLNFGNSLMFGNGNKVTGGTSDTVLLGNDIEVGSFSKSVAIGNGIISRGGEQNVLIGYNVAAVNGGGNIVIGANTEANASGVANTIAIGHYTTVTGAEVTSVGHWGNIQSSQVAALGDRITVGTESENSIAIGGSSSIGNTSYYSIAIGGSGGGDTEGHTSVKDNTFAGIALGYDAEVGDTSHYSMAMGSSAKIGNGSTSSMAMGESAKIGDSSTWSIAIGSNAEIGDNVEQSVALGGYNTVTVSRGTALGMMAKVNAAGGMAVGYNSSVEAGAKNSTAIGINSTVTDDDILTDDQVKAFLQDLNTSGFTYSEDYNIQLGDISGVVSVGAANSPRRIINVARGRISADSTDAVNGSQLYGAIQYLDGRIDGLANPAGGGEILPDDKNITIRHPEGEPQTGTGTGEDGSMSTINGMAEVNANADNTNTGSGSSGTSTDNTHWVGLNEDLVLGASEDNNFNAGSLTIQNTANDVTPITINKNDPNTGKGDGLVSGLHNTTWDWNKYENKGYAESTNAATEAQLHGALDGTVQYDRNEQGDIDKTNITLNPDGGSVTIHNVAAGKEDTDAVNYGQLKDVQTQVDNNAMAITNIGNKVGELDNRIDEVGAGAAALAALHPLDFDPDDKWDFAAGYGNYRGENAVAIGAFYRPNEDTMFSVGGTVGNSDNMINAGVSFKIGQGNGVTTSRVAMAKEIKAMRDVVAKQDAQIQKLTAMVNALVGAQAVEPDATTMFPDVPENHWAYEAVKTMVKSGLVKGYPDGEFKGDHAMTRYEFAQIVHNAIQAGVEVDARLVQEFKPELEYFHIATVAQDKDGNPTIQRVRAN